MEGTNFMQEFRRSVHRHLCLLPTLTFNSLFREASLTDAVIRCGGREWKVHRAILACHGKFFKRCWQEGFLVSCPVQHVLARNTYCDMPQESSTHILDLVDDELDAVERLLHHAYNFEYDDTPAEGSKFADALEINAVVYALADKYECADLGAIAAKKFSACCCRGLKACCTTLRGHTDCLYHNSKQRSPAAQRLYAAVGHHGGSHT